MGKLNIAHHKSYHPYRRDNIERVRRDEEEARLAEEQREGRMMLADSEARIEVLRERAGLGASGSKPRNGRTRDADEIAAAQEHAARQSTLPTTDGHINLFEDLEQQATLIASKASKKGAPAETEQGVPLAPSAKDLKPWYSEKTSERKGLEEDKRMRDLARKTMNDPLTSITHQLASRPSSSTSTRPRAPPPPAPPRGAPPPPAAPPAVSARLRRESSERDRARALVARKAREMRGSETPSTVRGGAGDYAGYGDVFNRKEVEEAHRVRERQARSWGWGEDRRKDGDGRREW